MKSGHVWLAKALMSVQGEFSRDAWSIQQLDLVLRLREVAQIGSEVIAVVIESKSESSLFLRRCRFFVEQFAKLFVYF